MSRDTPRIVGYRLIYLIENNLAPREKGVEIAARSDINTAPTPRIADVLGRLFLPARGHCATADAYRDTA